jgi:hypothetical protein
MKCLDALNVGLVGLHGIPHVLVLVGAPPLGCI